MNSSSKKALLEVGKLLSRYRIGSDDWILVGPQVYRAHGYRVAYDRLHHFHVMISKQKVPWKLPQAQKALPEVVPPFNSRFRKSCNQFIKKTGFDFDIIIAPKPLRDYLQNQVEKMELKKGVHCHVLMPIANERIEHHIYSQFPPEKYNRLIIYFKSILASAMKKSDKEMVQRMRRNIKRYQAIACRGVVSTTQASKQYKRSGLLKGKSAYPGLVSGLAKVIRNIDEKPRLIKNRIIVIRMSSPRTMKLISSSSALVTDEGGVLSHAAILSRELKIPCVIGTKIATKVLKSGDRVLVDATKGTVKKI